MNNSSGTVSLGRRQLQGNLLMASQNAQNFERNRQVNKNRMLNKILIFLTAISIIYIGMLMTFSCLSLKIIDSVYSKQQDTMQQIRFL